MNIVEVGNRFVHFIFIATEQLAAEAEAVVQAESLAEVRQILFFQYVAEENPLFVCHNCFVRCLELYFVFGCLCRFR